MHLHKETGRIALIGSPPAFFVTSLQFPQQKQQIRTHDQSAQGSDYIVLSSSHKKDILATSVEGTELSNTTTTLDFDFKCPSLAVCYP